MEFDLLAKMKLPLSKASYRAVRNLVRSDYAGFKLLVQDVGLMDANGECQLSEDGRSILAMVLRGALSFQDDIGHSLSERLSVCKETPKILWPSTLAAMHEAERVGRSGTFLDLLFQLDCHVVKEGDSNFRKWVDAVEKGIIGD